MTCEAAASYQEREPKVSEAESAVLEEHSSLAGLTLSERVRGTLLAAPTEPGAEARSEIVLAEVLALRLLFLNLQFRAPMSQILTARTVG